MSDNVYTSNFTGPQIDEAVGKVINNEIGGEAIKEGSIPYNALNTKEVTEVIKSEEQHQDITIDVSQYDKVNIIAGNVIKFKELDTKLYGRYSESYNEASLTVTIYKNGLLGWDVDDVEGIYSGIIIVEGVKFKKLDKGIIPDVISDVIDPVVWKYICNPIIIGHNKAVPNEILDSSGHIKRQYQNTAMYLMQLTNEPENEITPEYPFKGNFSFPIPLNWVGDIEVSAGVSTDDGNATFLGAYVEPNIDDTGYVWNVYHAGE